jgi:RNA polymerase sigma-B factor
MTLTQVATIEEKVEAQPSPSARAKTTAPGDSAEAVTRWLLEYVQLRDRAAEQAVSGGPLGEVKARLAHHYTTLVESVARRFAATGEPFEDLVQEGFLGLLSALDHYDPTKGVKFVTYATHFVAGSIRHYLRDRGKIIKEPAWLHELYGKINRATDTLTQRLNRAPSAGEIARELNLTEESVAEILATRQVFQVAAFATGGEDSEDSMVGLVDPEKIRSDHYVSLRLPIEDRIALEEATAKLKALEQKVLHEFFYKDHNQTEIAKKLGISCNYVSHILKNSTQKLRKIMGETDVRERTRFRESSITDAVSGLFTGPHATSRVEEALSRAARQGVGAAVIVLELRGLPASGLRREEAWSLCGETIRKTLRKADIAGRLEGDYALIFLPQAGDAARQSADHLCDLLAAAGAAHRVALTPRAGVALYPDESRSLRDLLRLALRQIELADRETDTDSIPLPVAA